MSSTARNDKHCSSVCLTCRKRKKRCSGTQPVCAQCAKNDLECVWATDDDRRTARRRERELYEEIEKLRAQNASLIALVGMLTAAAAFTSEAFDCYPAPGAPSAGPYSVAPMLHFGAAPGSPFLGDAPLAREFGVSVARGEPQTDGSAAQDTGVSALAYATHGDDVLPPHLTPPSFTGNAAPGEPHTQLY